MEMLTTNMLLAGDLWTNIINWFAGWIVNYGWTIIVFTILLKIVLSPLDILQRVQSQKQSRFMSVAQPELNAIQQKYANDREKLNAESAKIYKKYNMSMGGMCLSLLITLLVSFGVFISLFGSLRSYGDAKLYESYDKVYDAYTTTVGTDAEKIDAAKAQYEIIEKENTWLWVKNVWKADASNVNQFIDVDTYIKWIDSELPTDATEKEAAITKIKADYDIITKAIGEEKGTQNGYFVLLILAALVSFGAQFLSTKMMSPKGQKMSGMNKAMMAIIPISMVIFASTSNVVFTLYIITNSIMTALISTIISLIINRKNKNKTPEEVLLKKKDIEVVEYSRNYKK